MQARIRTRKRAVNVSIDAELIQAAKAAGTNLSAVLERALRDELSGASRQHWFDANRSAIEADHAELERTGPWYTPDWLSS